MHLSIIDLHSFLKFAYNKLSFELSLQNFLTPTAWDEKDDHKNKKNIYSKKYNKFLT